MNRGLLLVWAILIFLIPSTLSGNWFVQEVPEWEVVLVSRDGTALYIVTRNQVEYLAVPEAFRAYLGGATVAPNGRYLLYASGSQALPRLGDLSTLTCCTLVEPPVGSVEQVLEFRPGVFSDDGAFFTGTFVMRKAREEQPIWTTYLVIGESATGQIVESFQIPDDHPVRVPEAVTWAGDQIYLLPSCYACEFPVWATFPYFVWERTSGQINDTEQLFNRSFGDRLSLPGEFIVAKRNTDYPYDPEEGYYFSPNNVITYYPNGSSSDPPVIWYHNSTHLDLGNLHWVMDGQGYLFTNGEGQNAEYFLGLRDGTALPLSASIRDVQYVSPTPDGWLMKDTTGNLHLGSLQGGDIPIRWETLAEEFPVTELLLYTPNGTPMKNLLQEQIVDINCPAAIAPRLAVGERGRVTHGAANNLRTEPTIDSALVTQIPAEGEFMVIDGPICSGGLRYWQVDYQGTIGWTAEGEYDTYWLEPSN